MNKFVGLLVAVIGFVFGLGAVGTALAAPQDAAFAPRGDTIVEITGNKLDGFSIYRYDGSAQFPPTDSEARAECGEYDTQVARVRCRTAIRVWYRDLGETKRALKFAHAGG